MIPAVSRSGATIVAAMLFGADRRSARRILVLARDAGRWPRLRLRSLQVPRPLSGGNMMIVAIGSHSRSSAPGSW